MLHLLHNDARIIKFQICETKVSGVGRLQSLARSPHSTAQSQLEKLINCAAAATECTYSSNTSHWHLQQQEQRSTMKQMDERRMHLLLLTLVGIHKEEKEEDELRAVSILLSSL